MAHVEQAIFTSAQTNRSVGYQVAARSPGICEADVRELAVWGPSHDSLLELGPDATSFNFHSLPSGAYCLSRTTPAGWEYSGRGGHRVYTQCLIVPPEVLARFANNPFALMRAALAGGMLEIHDEVPRQLERLQLAGRAAAVNQALLSRLAADLGPESLAMVVHGALESTRLAISGAPSAEHLFAALISCLPPECRAEFSFSTGLKFSSRRPFRIVALSGDPSELRWVSHQEGVTVLDLSDDASLDSGPINGWAELIQRVLTSNRVSFLGTQLSKRRGDLTPADLPALGLQLLEELDASSLSSNYVRHDGADPLFAETAGADQLASTPDRSVVNPQNEPAESQELTCVHAAHRQFEESADAAAAAVKESSPSKTLHPCSPRVLEMLERLDDVVYEAISGQADSLEEVETLWTQVLAELGEDLVAESRQQYLCYALRIWEECVSPHGIRNPARAAQALNVLCVLFNDV